MATIAIRKTAWVNASASQKNVLRWAVAELGLGTPVEYADGGKKWYVFDDSRITLGHVATLGQVLKGLASWAQWAAPMVKDEDGNVVRVDRAAAAAEVYDFVKGDRVHPRDVEYDETVVVQVRDRERRTYVDPDTGDEHDYWHRLDTTHPVDEVRAKANPWQVTLDAQGAPAAIKAAGSVSANWEAVTDGE